ncbi:MAG: flagellar biosynthetic protein FliR, partial [Gammaproteobacteria bacterium]|nr:flagellar biosynthetic protein FliR [Gammaproteobacteria bacterium]
VAPIFGGRLVPIRVRVVLSVLVTWVLLPVIPAAPSIDPLSGAGVLVSAQQLLIGLLLGFLLQMVFTALMIAGHAIATGMGLGFASMVDPQNGVNVPVIGQYYVTVATLLFLALNGHLLLISVLADSFQSMPVAVDGISRQSLWDVVAWGSRMFAGGVLISIPAVTALLMTNIAFGVITRAAPQLHIFNIGFPITLALGFVVVFLSLPELNPQFGDLLGDGFDVIKALGPVGGAHG